MSDVRKSGNGEQSDDRALEKLAERAGLAVHWHDVRGERQTVRCDTLRQVLKAMELPCDSAAQVEESTRLLEHEASKEASHSFLISHVGEHVRLRRPTNSDSLSYRLELESGERVDGHLKHGDNGEYVLPAIKDIGYHKLYVGHDQLSLAVAPKRCFQISDVTGTGEKLWGIAAQLYSVRCRAGDVHGIGRLGGIGDFGALTELCELAAREGAAGVCISPIHAMFDADPHRYSPYSPSSRLFLNSNYIDPRQQFGREFVAKLASETGIATALASLDAQPLIDWPQVSVLRHKLLRELFARLHGTDHAALMHDFRAFRSEAGDALEDHARFEALQANLLAAFDKQDSKGVAPYSWRAWPEAFRDPRGEAVARFAKEHTDEVSYYAFLQWLAARGLADVQKRARAAGMPIGVIADLAVGTDGGGSQAWSRQKEILIGVSCGAPGDLINPLGQNWGLSAFSPLALRATGYAAFIEMLRATLAHAGGIRVDHVLGLRRMWLVPDGASAAEGAYLRYPFQDLLRLIALESWRYRAIVIGENLGTVPEGFNNDLYDAGVFGTSVLWFERAQDWFNAPRYWSPHTVATTTTHDLPSVKGWWRGHDIDWRVRLKLLDPKSSEQQERETRERDKKTLWTSLGHAGLATGPVPDDSQAPVDNCIAFVGRTPAPLVLLPLEDLCAYEEQPNLPGTTSGHPNWQRRLHEPIDQLFERPDIQHRIATLKRAREADA